MVHATACLVKMGDRLATGPRRAKLGQGPDPAPRWVGEILARVLQWVGPRGLEFGRYSIEYHYIRNWLYAVRHMGLSRAERHTPAFARKIIADYDADGAISSRYGELLA